MKRRIIAAVMAIGCAVSLWFGTGINGRAMTDLDVSEVVSKSIQEPEERDLQDMNISINEQEWMILYYTNGIRMANGLQPLSTFGALQSACDVRANELGTLFDHTRPKEPIAIVFWRDGDFLHVCGREYRSGQDGSMGHDQ